MKREDDADVGPLGEPGQGGADRAERRAQALPAMGGDQHGVAARFDGGQAGIHLRAQLRVAVEPVDHQVERVDAAIAGDVDVAAEPLGDEIVAGGAGRREMHVGDQADRPPVIFLGEGLAAAIGAQARLDMGDLDAAMEGGERGGEGGGGVALDDDAVGRGADEDRVEPLDQPGEERIERLLRRHDLEVEIRASEKKSSAGIEQVAMLAGHAQARFYRRLALQRLDHRRDLDGFRTRTENRQQLHHAPPALKCR